MPPATPRVLLVEISGHPGAKPIGPLPKELQVPLPYSALLGSSPKDEAAAEALLAGARHARSKEGLCQGRVRGEAVDAASAKSAVDVQPPRLCQLSGVHVPCARPYLAMSLTDLGDTFQSALEESQGAVLARRRRVLHMLTSESGRFCCKSRSVV